MNLVTALGFYSMFGSVESILGLEQKHEVVTAIGVEAFPGVLQSKQKYIRRWRDSIEVEMNLKQSDAYQVSATLWVLTWLHCARADTRYNL